MFVRMSAYMSVQMSAHMSVNVLDTCLYEDMRKDMFTCLQTYL